MPGINLNRLTQSAGVHGDYGVFDPVNAWPGAKDVIVSVLQTGASLLQIGYETTSPDTLWTRQRSATGVWSTWSQGADGGGGGDVGIEEAPNDGYSYVRRNGQWEVLVQMWTGDYMFNDTLVEPPGAGQLRLDTLDQTVATKIWMSGMSAPGNDILFYLESLDETRGLYLQDKDNSTLNQTYNITGPAVVKGGYVELPVVWSKGNSPLASQRILVTIMNLPPTATPAT